MELGIPTKGRIIFVLSGTRNMTLVEVCGAIPMIQHMAMYVTLLKNLTILHFLLHSPSKFY